jgi:erythromycin esterase-like protein
VALTMLLAGGSAMADSAAADLLHWAVQGRPLVLIGEVHGTLETPRLVGDLATLLAADGPLTVALEFPISLQPELDAFLAHDSLEAARRALLAGSFWTRDYQDGRSSQAMLELLERLRELRRQGHRLEVLAFDIDRAAAGAGADRDAAMAENLRSVTVEGTLLLLAGNYHVRTVPGAPWNPQQRFLGWHLRDRDPYSVDVTAFEGTYWVCTGSDAEDCGVRGFQRDAEGGAPRLVSDADIHSRGYSAQLILDRFTASPPASR